MFYDDCACRQSWPALISNLASFSVKLNKYMLEEGGWYKPQAVAAVISGPDLLLLLKFLLQNSRSPHYPLNSKHFC